MQAGGRLVVQGREAQPAWLARNAVIDLDHETAGPKRQKISRSLLFWLNLNSFGGVSVVGMADFRGFRGAQTGNWP